jgi:hypothetical protein
MGRAMKLLSFDDLRRLGVPWTKRHVRSLVRSGAFPPPLQVGARVLWIESEIEEWMRALPRARAAVPVVEPAPISTTPISTVVPLPRRRFRRSRRAREKAADAESRFAAVLQLMA